MSDAQLDALTAHLHHYRALLEAAAEGVPAHLRDMAPAAGGWSVHQVLDHVARIDTMVARLLAKLLPDTPAGDAADAAAIDAAVARLRSVLTRGTRVGAVPGSEPAAVASAAGIAHALAHARARLLGVVATTAGRDLTTVGFAHPIIGPLNLLEWIVFLGLHDGRHAAQIGELAAELAHAREPAS